MFGIGATVATVATILVLVLRSVNMHRRKLGKPEFSPLLCCCLVVLTCGAATWIYLQPWVQGAINGGTWIPINDVPHIMCKSLETVNHDIVEMMGYIDHGEAPF